MNADKQKTVELPSGLVTVTQEDNLIYARGIKYATATRFKTPQPLPPTGSPQNCTSTAPICPQNPSRLETVMGPVAAGITQSEDCLHLTLAAPNDGKNLPVMFFIHGGAFITGGGDLPCYDPRPLAKHNGVIVVNVTYRLGVLGFLHIPGVVPANLGIQDQILALQWVQTNISYFGGDPNNVTLFGQSAGAMSIYCLLSATNITQPLFHRAILQSGYYDWPAEPDRDKVHTAVADYTASNIPNITDPTVPATDLLALQAKLMPLGATTNGTLAPLAPIFGEYPLPPYSEVPSRLLKIAERVPILIGTTTHEGTAFIPGVSSPNNAKAEQLTRTHFHDGAARLVELISKVSPVPTYEFTWHPEGTPWGATHCIELPFLLGEYDVWAEAPMLGRATREFFETFGKEVKRMWAAFAKGEDLASGRWQIGGRFRFEVT